eukprot:2768791-Rhodomonas_salina.1
MRDDASDDDDDDDDANRSQEDSDAQFWMWSLTKVPSRKARGTLDSCSFRALRCSPNPTRSHPIRSQVRSRRVRPRQIIRSHQSRAQVNGSYTASHRSVWHRISERDGRMMRGGAE